MGTHRLPRWLSSVVAGWKAYANHIIAAEVSAFSRYYDRVYQVAPLPGDRGELLDAIDNADRRTCAAIENLPDLRSEADRRTLVLMKGNFNHDLDIQGTLISLHGKFSRTTRLAVVAYNPYYGWLYRLANQWGIRQGQAPSSLLTQTDLRNIARLSGFDVVRLRTAVYVPFRLFGLTAWINRVFPAVPLLRWTGLVTVIVLRPIVCSQQRPSLTIVIPARNERGNIEPALQRLPSLGAGRLEVVFVEGHSTDGTWEEIQRVLPLYADRAKLKALRQTGKGKSDAVRLGFAHAANDLLVILDADLTMPPELLHRFYDAYVDGHADFVNGSRLVYPMENNAMRPLNRLGNLFFAKALSVVLGVPIGDSLCGTKLVTRHDYERFGRWRADFGDFDPFGDFELLFPAAVMALGIVDVPVRYRDRTYGSTNISRFTHGWMLLKMTIIGLRRIRLGVVVRGDTLHERRESGL